MSDDRKQRISVLLFSSDISTRIMVETALHGTDYKLDISQGRARFLDEVQAGAHDIYMIDTFTDAGSDTTLFNEAVELKKKGLRRIVLLIPGVPKPGMNMMRPFGPLCFLEVFFTQGRLMQTLFEVMELKDTGSRVKADNKFFDVNVFKNK